MKAIVYGRYGSPEVLELKETAKPTPKDREVLIKVYATTVTAGDWRARTLNVPRGFGLISRLFFGISRPRQPILGSELSGEIESVGKAVSKFKVGDQIFAYYGASLGCYVEYKCMPEDGALALKPANLSYEEAASISFGGTTALASLRRAKIQNGDKVLINGASGGVGTAAVQLARHFGAEVTVVCSTGNIELVKSIGADKVIDYTKEDFTQNGETYDIIVGTAGTAPYSRSNRSLKEEGRLLVVLGTLLDMLQAPWLSMTSSKRVFVGPVSGGAEDLRFLASLAESGHFKPVIDRRYPFERIAEAHRYVDTGRYSRGSSSTLTDGDETAGLATTRRSTSG
jgi:NADPH:quinone reductase-like Zn-dependent oxidoreductase